MVYMIVMIEFPLAKRIKCMLFCQGIVCVLARSLGYGYKIYILYKIWLRRF